jgi:hypothetical protein
MGMYRATSEWGILASWSHRTSGALWGTPGGDYSNGGGRCGESFCGRCDRLGILVSHDYVPGVVQGPVRAQWRRCV